MKCYLHGPREGQTVIINGVQFINGVADMPSLPIYFERYYNVKDYPPASFKGENTTINFHINALDVESVTQTIEKNRKEIQDIFAKPSTKAEEPSDEDILRNVVETKKAEIAEAQRLKELEKATIVAEEATPKVVTKSNKLFPDAPPVSEHKLPTDPTRPLVEQYLELTNSGYRISFCKQHTGLILRGKDEAVAKLKLIDEANGFK